MAHIHPPGNCCSGRFFYWQDGRFRLGYLEEYPDYLTQGESLQDLQEHPRDL